MQLVYGTQGAVADTALPQWVDDDSLKLCVARKDYAAHDTVILDLVDPGGKQLPAWTPGGHIELKLPLASGSHVVRQYSLCSPPDDGDRWRLAILRDENSRGGSLFLHDLVREGDLLHARRPRNHFAFHPSSSVLFIAGGIGITPILPMLHEAASNGVNWRLLYLVRKTAAIVFRDEIEALGRDRVAFHTSEIGGRYDLRRLLSETDAGTAVYACGPMRMLDDLEQLKLRGAKWHLHLERFHNPNRDTRPLGPEEFDVVSSRTGRSFRVGAGESILDALRRNKIDVQWSCCDGVCGSCQMRVVEGVPDHRDAVLTQAERDAGDTMMVCVSRSRGPRLVLDF